MFYNVYLVVAFKLNMKLNWDKPQANKAVRVMGSILMLESFIIIFLSISRFSDLILAAALFILGRISIVLTESDFWDNLFEPHNKQVYKIRKVKRK